MREFSPFEKRALLIIVNNDPSKNVTQNFETLVRNLFDGQNIGLNINPIATEVVVSYSSDKSMGELLLINKVIDDLIGLQVLFEYLQNNSYAKLYNYGYNGDSIQNKECKYNTSKEIKDEQVNAFYCNHWMDQFYATEALRVFVGNDFKSEEQIRFNDQMKDAKKKHTESMAKANLQIKIGWAAFVVSILAVLAAIIVPRYTKTSLAEKKEIIEAIESTKIEIPESINSVITNDNLEVSITNEQLDVNVKNRQINATITNDTLNVKTTNR